MSYETNIQVGKFRHGASEFMSYWLPMILVTGQEESDRHIAYIMVFKYRKASLTKEEAEKISKEELDNILKSFSQIKNISLKAKKIIESLKLLNYYPAPEHYPKWEYEWNINFFKKGYCQ